MLTTSITAFDCADPATGSFIDCPVEVDAPVWVRLGFTLVNTYDAGSPNSWKERSTDNISWDSCGGRFYGNVAQTQTRGSGSTADVNIHMDYACVDEADSYIVDKPTHVWVCEGPCDTGTKLEEKWFFYDGLGLGAVAEGNATRVESWLEQYSIDPGTCTANGSAKCVKTSTTYDAFGNLRDVTDAQGRTTVTEYDPETQIYPDIVTNELDQKVAMRHDAACGKLLWQTMAYTDADGAPETQPRSEMQYDSFCRLVSTWRPDQEVTDPAQEIVSYSLGGRERPTSVQVSMREPTGAGGYKQGVTLSDALGRVIQAKTATHPRRASRECSNSDRVR